MMIISIINISYISLYLKAIFLAYFQFKPKGLEFIWKQGFKIEVACFVSYLLLNEQNISQIKDNNSISTVNISG